MKYVKLFLCLFSPFSLWASIPENKKGNEAIQYPKIAISTDEIKLYFPKQKNQFAIMYVSYEVNKVEHTLDLDSNNAVILPKKNIPHGTIINIQFQNFEYEFYVQVPIEKFTHAAYDIVAHKPKEDEKCICEKNGILLGSSEEGCLCAIAKDKSKLIVTPFEPEPLTHISVIIDQKITAALTNVQSLKDTLKDLNSAYRDSSMTIIALDKEILKLYDSYMNEVNELLAIQRLMKEHAEYTKEKVVESGFNALNRFKHAFLFELILPIINDHISQLIATLPKPEAQTIERQLYGKSKDNTWNTYSRTIVSLRLVLETCKPLLHGIKATPAFKRTFTHLKKRVSDLLRFVEQHIRTSIMLHHVDQLFLDRWPAIYGRIKSSFEQLNNELVEVGFITAKINVSKTHTELIELAENAQKLMQKQPPKSE